MFHTLWSDRENQQDTTSQFAHDARSQKPNVSHSSATTIAATTNITTITRRRRRRKRRRKRRRRKVVVVIVVVVVVVVVVVDLTSSSYSSTSSTSAVTERIFQLSRVGSSNEFRSQFSHWNPKHMIRNRLRVQWRPPLTCSTAHIKNAIRQEGLKFRWSLQILL